MKTIQASCDRSSWLRTFLSRGCLIGSLVQLHIEAFPLFLVIITLLRVCLGGGLERGRNGEREREGKERGKAKDRERGRGRQGARERKYREGETGGYKAAFRANSLSF